MAESGRGEVVAQEEADWRRDRAVAQLFDEMDEDGNGVISRAEFDHALGAKHALRGLTSSDED